MSRFQSTLLPKLKDTETETEVRKMGLDLLKKINEVSGYYVLSSGTNDNGCWIELTNGMLIQWGESSTSTATSSESNGFGSTAGTMYYTDLAVTFPKPFPAGAVIVPTRATGSVGGRAPLVVGSTFLSTGVSIRMYANVNGTSVQAAWVGFGWPS